MTAVTDVLDDLHAARRSRRFEKVDLFERLYQAYVTVIGIGIGTVVAAGFLGDTPLSASAATRVATDGPAWVGLAMSLVLVAGLRSGMRGGPLALEAPYVFHVLLSPVSRAHALRRPAWAQLRQAAIIGLVSGGATALAAGDRLGRPLPLVAGHAALAGALVGLTATGAAMIVSGTRPPRAAVHLLSLALVAASAFDISSGSALSPGTWLGRLAMGGMRFDWRSTLALPAGAAVATVGLLVVGGLSIEAARTRAGLVSEVRVAVTRQDLRTVVLLQRRLAQDHARSRPWIRVPGGRAPVLRRGLRSLVRLPAGRLARVVALVSIACVAGVAVWNGTTPMIVVVGVAVWAASLDIIEPMAQELDHPSRWAGYPIAPGQLLVRHLAAPAFGLVLLAGAPIAALAALGGRTAALAAVGVLPAAVLAGVMGAACSVATSPFDVGSMGPFATPEALGMQLIFRVAWPPALVVVSCLPLLAGRGAPNAAVLGTELGSFVPVMLVVVLAGLWLSTRTPARF